MTECSHCGRAMQRVSVYCICGAVLPFESHLAAYDANHLESEDSPTDERTSVSETTQATLGDVA